MIGDRTMGIYLGCRWFGCLCLLAAGAALSGCVTPGDRGLVDQSRQAAKLNATDPDVPEHARVRSRDVVANLTALQTNGGVPAPKTPQKYSSEASKQARDDSKREHETIDSIGSGVLGFVGSNIPGGMAIVGLLGTLWGLAKKRLGDKKTFSFAKGVSDFSQKLPGIAERVKDLDLKTKQGLQDLVAIMRTELKDAQKIAASTVGVAQEIGKDIKAHQAAGTIKPIDTKTLAEKTNDPSDPLGQ